MKTPTAPATFATLQAYILDKKKSQKLYITLPFLLYVVLVVAFVAVIF